MKQNKYLVSALVGFLTSLVVMALSYLGNLWLKLPFLPFDLFDWLTRHLPGSVVEAGIRSMVSVIIALNLGPTDTTAKLAEQIQALALVAGAGVVLGLLLAWCGLHKLAWLRRIGLWGGAILWLGAVVAEASLPQTSPSLSIGLGWLLVLLLGWGWILAGLVGAVVGAAPARQTEVDGPAPAAPAAEGLSRRNFLVVVGTGLASLLVLLFGLGKYSREKVALSSPVNPGAANPGGVNTGVQSVLPYGPQYTSGPAASPSLDALAKRIAAAPGTRAEVTTPDKFYRIDINLFPPQVDAGTWKLTLKGLVQTPMTWTLDQIRAMPAISQAITQECISNPLGGDLISGNFWTGVRFKDILAQAGLSPQAKEIHIMAVDGFYESVPVEEAMDDRTLLVYAMNGEPLPQLHGFPLRIYIPNHYGMKQPKWISEMVASDMPLAGYWVERGWSMTAHPQTTSIIDTQKADPAELQKDGVMPLGGIAFAGDRGISKVEVQIDDGPWQAAQLRTPALSPLTWVEWRYDWKTTPGSHQVGVRATDGTGALQIAEDVGPSPDGATGIQRVTIQI